MARWEMLGGAALIFLAGVALGRAVGPGERPMRRLSIEGIHIPTEPINTGETVAREGRWRAPARGHVVGWGYAIGARDARPELSLFHGQTELFHRPSRSRRFALNPAFYQSGAGCGLETGEELTLRFRLTNTGPPGETLGARALVYFVPAP